MSQAKDFTISTFGLLIAYLLPGFLVLYGVSFWSPQVEGLFNTFRAAKSDVGLSLLMLMASLTAGLILSPMRHLLYEVWCRFGAAKLESADFQKLGEAGKLDSFRTVVDEHYRHHQFYGHCSLAILPVAAGLVRTQGSHSTNGAWLVSLSSVAVEAALIYAARNTYKKYVDRAKIVLA
ncbi:hypothetical protein ACIBCA_24670 [Kitasatospora sp. NPDC051170]|uniref:hypothetical protein n=1 Tax=Kitasatospora sp. NPDC051170 TaxID=3364056 RepID=UPI0037A37DF3